MTGAATTTADRRVAELRAALGAAGLDALVATSDASIAYLTGFWGLQLERLFAVVVTREGAGGLIVPRLDEEAAGQAPTALPIVAYDAASDGLPELLATLGGSRRVGVEEHHLVHGRALALAAAGCELVPAAEVVMALRQAKDAEEVERVRRACGLVTGVLERMFAELRPGVTERAVNAQVEFWLREAGATASHPLILFGEQAANPHAAPGPRALREGDVVCADVSAQLDGYWGDLTRCGTVGAPTAWAQATWRAVLEAQAAAIAMTRSGTSAREVDQAQRDVLAAADSTGAMLHGAGHAIGVEIHEPPFLVPRDATALTDGMIFTIEPGLYETGTGGIRLEDCVLVTSAGPELLSDLPLELRRIPT